ncbi:hypothetical protein [Neorhodopirellula lusitana]|uniref:hypothetical protein n=1 Tax=Neorhodopirellula lusitana TaxID=445327 RepID=UPI0038502577
MSTLNPYDAVVVTNVPNVRIHAIPFAVSATLAFEITAIASTGNALAIYVGTPTAVVRNVLPAFFFAFLVGRFNSSPRTDISGSTALAGRFLGGCLLGATAIPVNWMVLDYLYLIPLPSKVAEVLTVLLIPVIICTLSERMFLGHCAPKRETRIG